MLIVTKPTMRAQLHCKAAPRAALKSVPFPCRHTGASLMQGGRACSLTRCDANEAASANGEGM